MGIKKIALTQVEFKQRIASLYGSKYSIKTPYVTSHDLITLTCNKHGDFSKVAYTLFQGSYCPNCMREHLYEKKTQAFITKAHKIHGNKYLYNQTKYVRCNSKVKITCKKHGMFFQSPDCHVNHKAGCGECSKKRSAEGLYNAQYFSRKNPPGFFYIVEFYNDNERFVKIGITKQSKIEKRFGSQALYKLKVIKFQQMQLARAYVLEQEIKMKYLNFKYEPKNKFGGYTECFTTQLLENISV